MIKIITRKEYENLTQQNVQLKEVLKAERKKRKETIENFDLIVHCAGKKSKQALETLVYVANKAIKDKYPTDT